MIDRCVCGYFKSAHDAATLLCPDNTGRKYGTRQLPDDGKTCGDCAHFKRTCEWLISYSGKETSCDWYPIKFQPKEQPK